MADEDKLPADPISELKSSAIHLHELYVSYVEAGFREDQAFSLICIILQTTIAASANASEGG